LDTATTTVYIYWEDNFTKYLSRQYGGKMAGREYRMKKRAEALSATRQRIVQATMDLHDKQGVIATSYLDIAERAAVGAATVYRHFPTLGLLVTACGARVWETIRPPLPEDAPAVFDGLDTRQRRLDRLVAELDALYGRGASILMAAIRDRDRVPELDAFLRRVEAGVEALVREAFRDDDLPDLAIQLAVALTNLPVWLSLGALRVPPKELARLKARLIDCAVAAASARDDEAPRRPRRGST
jgi:AcrR family transcriptional regulator